MKLTDLFLDELEREAASTRRVLERVPDGRYDWKPHDKSMSMGQLSTLVATMPSWVVYTVKQDELDLNPPNGQRYEPPSLPTSADLVRAHDEYVAQAREALKSTTDEHLMTPWRLLLAGKLVSEDPKYVVLRDSVFNHLAHHRGQLTVYLRLNEAKVPPVYGPTADEGR